MKKTIENMTIKEKTDLFEYCVHQIYKLKDLLLKIKSDLEYGILNDYIIGYKLIILKIKETLHVTN
jgi:hypothetical protein